MPHGKVNKLALTIFSIIILIFVIIVGVFAMKNAPPLKDKEILSLEAERDADIALKAADRAADRARKAADSTKKHYN